MPDTTTLEHDAVESIAQVAALRGEVQSLQELLRQAFAAVEAAQTLCNSAHVLSPCDVALHAADPVAVQRMTRKLGQMKALVDGVDSHALFEAAVATEVIYEHATNELKRLSENAR